MTHISSFPARVACLFLAAAFSSVSLAAQSPDARPSGTILVVRATGEAYATLPGDTLRTPLRNGSPVLVGQVIVTGKNASVMLILSNGATVTVAGDSVMAVEEFTQQPFAEAFRVSQLSKEPTSSTTRLNLVRGEITADVKKLNKEAGSSFNVKTPVGVAGIRGTAFRLAFLPSGGGRSSLNLVTLEGEVGMQFPDRPAPMLVSQGQQLKVDQIRTNPSTGEAKISASEGVAVAEVSASERAAIAQTVKTMISDADAVPVAASLAPSPADNAGAAAKEKAESESAEQPAPSADVSRRSLPPPARFPGWAGNSIRPRS
ncbi:MAG: FecR family protein [Opitutaceae bacterium]|jgi:hypothetical protein|nr:FecR family protein [Opitutaceae bacterium]